MRKWTRQPLAYTPIDWLNPLSHRLVYAYNFNAGATPQADLVNGAIPTNVDMTTGNVIDSRFGCFRSMATTGTTGDIWNTNFDPGWSSSQAISGVCLMRTSNASDPGHIIGQRDGTTTVWQFYHNGSGGLTFRKDVSASSSAGYIADTSWFLFGWSCSDLSTTGDCRVFKNGAFVQNLSVAANADALATDITLGHRWEVEPTTGYEGPFDFGLVALWDRKLTDEEHAKIADNPWQIFKPRLSFALADPLPDTRALNVPEKGINHIPSDFAMNQDGTGQQGYYTTLPNTFHDNWHMYGMWVTKSTAAVNDNPISVNNSVTDNIAWATQTADTSAPQDMLFWSRDIGSAVASTSNWMALNTWYYLFGIMYYDKAGGASPSHEFRLIGLTATGAVASNESGTNSSIELVNSTWDANLNELGIGDWGPTVTTVDEPWIGNLFNLKWWSGDDAIAPLRSTTEIYDFVRSEAFNFKPQWHTDTCLWYPLDSKWKNQSPWSHLPQLGINSGGAPVHNASGVPRMKQSQDLYVPIEYQELTFDDDAEERLFMIPQKSRQPR